MSAEFRSPIIFELALGLAATALATIRASVKLRPKHDRLQIHQRHRNDAPRTLHLREWLEYFECVHATGFHILIFKDQGSPSALTDVRTKLAPRRQSLGAKADDRQGAAARFFLMGAMTRPHHRLSPMLLPIGCALILMTAHSSAVAGRPLRTVP
jgi:hypothetical protein